MRDISTVLLNGLRDYGVAGQIGLESTPAEFIARLVEVFAEVRRVLRSDGTCWVNMGDTYAGGGNGGGGSFAKDGIRCAEPGTDKNKAMRVGSRGITRGKRIDRGSGRWGGGNVSATGDLKPKDLMGMPWALAFALRDSGWWLRQDIIWSKPNPMPESVRDRCTKAHEYVFLLTKSERYYYDVDAIREPTIPDPRDTQWGLTAVTTRHDHSHDRERGMMQPSPVGFIRMSNPLGRNKRSVWTLATMPTPDAHFATFPLELPEICILAGCPEGGTVLDPFCGAGTSGLAALKHGRLFIGIELNPAYIEIAHKRVRERMPLLAEAAC